MKYELFTDGGSRSNPGKAAVGAVLYGDERELATVGEYIGVTTNNVAEYQALLHGLELALKHKVKILACFLDSELVVNQINRKFKVKDKNLAQLFIKVWNLAQQFESVTFEHIRREKNKRADQLVNQALDRQEYEKS